MYKFQDIFEYPLFRKYFILHNTLIIILKNVCSFTHRCGTEIAILCTNGNTTYERCTDSPVARTLFEWSIL